MILRIAMTGRKDDFKLSRLSIFSPQNQYQLPTRPNRITLPNNRTDPQEKTITNFHGSLLHMNMVVEKMKNSLTPKRNIQQQRYYSPKFSLVSEYFTGNKVEKKITAGNQASFNTIDNAEFLAPFVRRSEEIAPLVFLRGEIQINQVSDTHHLKSLNNIKTIQISIPKLINFSKQDFDPYTLAFYILGTQKPVHQSQINLQPGDYIIILKALISHKIHKQKTQKSLYLQAQYEQKGQNLYKINFVVVLRNQKNKQVLYWRNYLNPEQLINELKNKVKGHRKVQQVI